MRSLGGCISFLRCAVEIVVVLGGPVGWSVDETGLSFKAGGQVKRPVGLSRSGRHGVDRDAQRHVSRQRNWLVGANMLAVKMGAKLNHFKILDGGETVGLATSQFSLVTSSNSNPAVCGGD